MLFIGPLFRREQAAEIDRNTKQRHSNASNSFQWNIIDGLCADLGHGISVINALPVGTWPQRYRKAVLPDADWQLDGVPCREIGCVNLPLLKQFGRFRRLAKHLKGIQNEEILLCTAYMPFLWALSGLDRSNRLTLLVTDLPEYADMHRVSAARRLLRRWNNRMIYRFMKRVDRFVLLTEQMKGPLGVGERPYIVMEGIYALAPEPVGERERKRAVFYSGRLNARYGVQELLDAFSMLDDEDLALWICGSGEMERAVQDAAAKDRRIRFLGFQKQETVWAMQRKASLLVNPRRGDEAFTKYSFPSKTMEYLASATPVLMYKLEGVPDEYDQYLNYVHGAGPAALAAAIRELLGPDAAQWEQKAEMGRQFILREKNAAVQAGRILALLREDGDGI